LSTVKEAHPEIIGIELSKDNVELFLKEFSLLKIIFQTVRLG
jgi:hypothetical protein